VVTTKRHDQGNVRKVAGDDEDDADYLLDPSNLPSAKA